MQRLKEERGKALMSTPVGITIDEIDMSAKKVLSARLTPRCIVQFVLFERP
jgi:hypothetical protein